MRNVVADYLLPFLLFLFAIFILCYQFKNKRYRMILLLLFVVGCFVRMFI